MLRNTDRVYHDLLQDIIVNGHKKEDRTGTGTKSVYGRQIRFNMKDGFPLLTTKKLHLRSIIHELLWFLKGDTNIKYLKENGVSIWDEWADEEGNLGPVYGKQWIYWEGIDYSEMRLGVKNYNQIEKLINDLNHNPDSRRMIVSAWNVGDLKEMALMPCHYGFQVYTRELSEAERLELISANDKRLVYEEVQSLKNVHRKTISDCLDRDNIPTREISLMWNQRSVDTFLGLPFNIASYGLLLEMLAQQTNMVAGELIGNLGDTHLYLNHLDYVSQQLTRDSIPCNPQLKLNKAKDIFSYKFEDFKITGYEAHPNWKNVPIAV